jgi:hypothetical protein
MKSRDRLADDDHPIRPPSWFDDIAIIAGHARGAVFNSSTPTSISVLTSSSLSHAYDSLYTFLILFI